MTIMSALKLAIRAPRPFFVVPAILTAECKVAEFGSPSGHSLIAATCFLSTAMVTLRYMNASGRVKAITYYGVVAPIVIYTGLSRIYEGMHSIDQVISGTLQGIIIA